MNIIKTLSISYYIGMVLLLVGILFKLNDMPNAIYFLAIGYLPFISARLYNFINGKAINKRMHFIMFVSALFLGASIIAIYFNRSYWIIGVLITATLDFYVSFRKYR